MIDWMLTPENNLSPSLFHGEEEVSVRAEVILNFLKKVSWCPSYRLSNPYLYPCLVTYRGLCAILESPCGTVVGVESVCE